MTPEQQTLLNDLQAWVTLRRQMDIAEQFHYMGMQDFLLKHGQWYDVAPWNDKYPHGAPKMCFGNSLHYATTRRWRYVEGVVAVKGLEFLPIHHAWNLDASGRLIDTTLRNEALLYFGVEFSVGRARDALNREMAVLDDYGAGLPMFRQPWQGEDFLKVWKRRPAKRAIF